MLMTCVEISPLPDAPLQVAGEPNDSGDPGSELVARSVCECATAAFATHPAPKAVPSAAPARRMDGRNIVSSEVCEEKTREDTGKYVDYSALCGLCVCCGSHTGHGTHTAALRVA